MWFTIIKPHLNKNNENSIFSRNVRSSHLKFSTIVCQEIQKKSTALNNFKRHYYELTGAYTIMMFPFPFGFYVRSSANMFLTLKFLVGLTIKLSEYSQSD